MMTNLSDSINTILKGTHNLLIIVVVKSTYFRLAALFVKKGREAEAQLVSKQVFSQALLRAVDINRQQKGTMTVSTFSQATSPL